MTFHSKQLYHVGRRQWLDVEVESNEYDPTAETDGTGYCKATRESGAIVDDEFYPIPNPGDIEEES